MFSAKEVRMKELVLERIKERELLKSINDTQDGLILLTEIKNEISEHLVTFDDRKVVRIPVDLVSSSSLNMITEYLEILGFEVDTYKNWENKRVLSVDWASTTLTDLELEDIASINVDVIEIEDVINMPIIEEEDLIEETIPPVEETIPPTEEDGNTTPTDEDEDEESNSIS